MGLLGWLAALWIALIFWGGSGRFGRAGTQRMIDAWRHHPRVHALLDRWHGEIRAAWHYIEFGALSLIVYLILHGRGGGGLWTWWAALGAIAISTVVAYLDEKRQELTPGRQFRTIDFVHSVRGLVGMQVLIALVALVRWLSGAQ